MGKHSSIVESNPDLAALWHPTRNGELSPKDVSLNSKKKFWWLGVCGHETFQQPINRSGSTGCSICAGRQVLSGFNDLASQNPQLASEWHPTKNAPLSPDQVILNSNKYFWWRASCGHEWESKLSNRTAKESGCPVCSGKLIVPGINDLQTLNPTLAAEWHPSKNLPRKVDAISPGSNTKAWWLGQCGHEWEALISNRKKGIGCPICSNKKMVPGFNDLATTNPELAAQWHPTKNLPRTTQSVSAGSNTYAYWVCKRGHEWRAWIVSRNSGIGCPICSNKKLLSGYNDLATTFPGIAAEWHPILNGSVLPSQISGGYQKSAYWLCPKGHEYKMVVNARTQGGGCPVCAGKRVLTGFNDLATTRPDIAESWHPTKNGSTTPQDIMSGTGKRYWWLCPDGHEWLATGNTRLISGCPTCAPYGYKPGSQGILYFIQNRELSARKIGITNLEDKNIRLEAFKKKGWEILFELRGIDGKLAAAVETSVLKQWIRNELGMGQYLSKEEMGKIGGWTETFSIDGVSNEEIIFKIQEEEIRLRQQSTSSNNP